MIDISLTLNIPSLARQRYQAGVLGGLNCLMR